MYAGAARAGLGVVELVDPFDSSLLTGDVGDLQYDETTGVWYQPDGRGTGDISLTPTTITTQATPTPAPILVQPLDVDRTTTPQPLPPLTASAPAPAGSLVSLLWIGVALFGSYVVLEDMVKSRKRGR